MKAIASLLVAFFPWSMPWNDTAKTVTDMSYLNPAPITEQRRVVARDGHLYDQNGKRVRLLGVNIAWSACFPEKKDAEIAAARLRKLGVNLVRLHNMDIDFAPRGIFDPKFKDMRHLDKDQLDRLDYFVAQLKQNGIYIDLNLLVGRKLDAADDLKEDQGLSAAARKGAVYFYPPFIKLQKEYAESLLNHYNPYTKNRYSQEPALALVETVNERTLVGQGRSGALQSMPEDYEKVLLSGWNDFLQSKYTTAQALENAWFGSAAAAAPGENVLQNSAFAGNALGWKLEADAPVIAQASTVPAEVPELAGMYAYQLKIQYLSGQAWQLQLHQMGLDLSPQTNYTLSFWAKSAGPRSMRVNLQSDQSPWQKVAPPHVFHLDKNWKRYSAVYQVVDPVPGHTRLSFVLGDNASQFWIAGVELRPGGKVTLPEGESLEQQNIALPLVSKTPAGQDALEYLSSLETSHMQDMHQFLRNTLKVQAPIIGSHPLYGGLSGVHRDAALDVVDMHGYWGHPVLKGGDWGTATVSSKPMVADPNGGAMANFAVHRVQGKPFTVTEFNEGPPNQFRAEALPMMASFAAWQDWDGLVLFDYNDNRDRWKEPAFGSFFRMQNDPAILAMFPVAANIFLRGDLSPVAAQSVLQVPMDQYPALAVQYLDTWTGMRTFWKDQGYSRDQLLKSRWSTEFVPSGVPHVQSDLLATNILTDAVGNTAKAASNVAAPAPVLPLQWKLLPGGGLYTVDTAASKIIIGKFDHTPSSPLQVSGFQISPGATKDHFVSATLTALDNQPIAQSSKVLLTLAGMFTNTGFAWNENNSVQYWGHAPMLAEAVPATVKITINKPTATVYALDATGRRLNAIPSRMENGQVVFTVTDSIKTIWYEISAQ